MPTTTPGINPEISIYSTGARLNMTSVHEIVARGASTYEQFVNIPAISIEDQDVIESGIIAIRGESGIITWGASLFLPDDSPNNLQRFREQFLHYNYNYGQFYSDYLDDPFYPGRVKRKTVVQDRTTVDVCIHVDGNAVTASTYGLSDPLPSDPDNVLYSRTPNALAAGPHQHNVAIAFSRILGRAFGVAVQKFYMGEEIITCNRKLLTVNVDLLSPDAEIQFPEADDAPED